MSTHCKTNTEYLTLFQHHLELAEETMVLADDADFVRHLIITLIATRLRGATIRLAYFPKTTEDAEPRLLDLLRGLGVFVHVHPPSSPPPLTGAFFDPLSSSDCAFLIRLSGLERHGIVAKVYAAPTDTAVIRATFESCVSALPEAVMSDFQPFLQKADIGKIISRLKSRSHYRNAAFDYREVSPEEVFPQKQQIRRFKHNQVRLLRSLYDRERHVHYEALQVVLRGGGFSFITPPVLEQHNGRLIIAEGHTRLFCSRDHGDKGVMALVARNVASPLPSEASEWASVAVIDGDVDGGENPEKLLYARKIESCTHLNSDWKMSEMC